MGQSLLNLNNKFIIRMCPVKGRKFWKSQGISSGTKCRNYVINPTKMGSMAIYEGVYTKQFQANNLPLKGLNGLRILH